MSESNEGQELTVKEYNEETGEVTLVDDAGNTTIVKIIAPASAADVSQTDLPTEVGGRKRRKNKSKRKKSHKKSMRRRK